MKRCLAAALLWILCWGCAAPAPAAAAGAAPRPASAEEPWQAALERAAAAKGLRGASLSALVVDRRSGAVLWAREADALLIPASTQKLLTAVAALDAFGPAHRFVTELRASRPIGTDGAVGDLFVRGGDPSLTSEQWWRLAADLRALGLLEVRGDLVLDDSLFDAVRWHSSWGPITARAYHAPVGALSANFGAFRVRVGPGAAAGAPLEARVDPPIGYFSVENGGRTGKARSRSTLSVERRSAEGAEQIRVQGSVPVGAAPNEIWRSTADPLAYAGAVLRMQLEANGIRVAGAVRRGVASSKGCHSSRLHPSS
jgi:D-alanyl-D-alanine carboxypeptidase/D-alanyl-D-alanine-endopeptidase (penicillin-binding protein 4)